jgi:HAD superfamily hydrolase (TIGR01484 family)
MLPPPSAPTTLPRPWAQCPQTGLAQLRGVMTDIDDTLTDHGELGPAATAALHRLAEAGVPVVAITGRPLGWSETLLRTHPAAATLRALVAENGAVALLPGPGGWMTEFAQDAATRRAQAARLRQVLARVLAEVPGTLPARDSAGRVTDIAIDHSEFAHLPAAAIEQVVALMRAEGMTATVSSIHINGWFGSHNKFSGAQWMVHRLFGRRLDDELERWVYVGDSTNDQTMFGHFPLSVGVANLMNFRQQLHTWPAWITPSERGAGFAEVADAVLAARSTTVST